MKYLALDIGTRRTGVAFADAETNVAVSLPTLEHASDHELIDAITQLCGERKVDQIVLGLPRLPSGEEGAQAQHVRTIGQKLEAKGLTIQWIDERYSSARKQGKTPLFYGGKGDGDALAATQILEVFLSLTNSKNKQ